MDSNQDIISQYSRIATDIAAKIADGTYPENTNIPGISALSAQYGVSYETVRKAISVLAADGIVQSKKGNGTKVLSKSTAGYFLERANIHEEQLALLDNLKQLLDDYSTLGQKIVEVSETLIDSRYTPMPVERSFPLYQITIPPNSDIVGKSIGDLRFWQRTGATIVALSHGQHVQVSPGPYAIIHAGDELIYVGPAKTRQSVHQLVTYGTTESTIYRIQEQINTMLHMKELSIVAEVLDARLGDITDFIAMSRGMTNHSYMFSCKGKRYILRIPGEGTVNLVDRAHEAEVYRAIAGTGVCDDVIYLNPANGLKVTRFIDDVRLCDPYREEDLRMSMDLLRRFHQIGLKVNHSFDIFENIELYESLWGNEPSGHWDYEETKAQVFSLRDYIEAHRGELCLTHIDAVPDNFLFYERDGKTCLQLIDWEYAGMQDPHVDIAMFCLYSNYNRAQVDHLIDLYFENECPRQTRIKIYCYISACGLLWSNWAEYKRVLGVEYGDYAAHQYQYAKDYYQLVRKELDADEEAV